MKSIYLLLTILSMSFMYSQEKTTIYLIRHAEKAEATGDPDLSEAGKARANRWAEWLADKDITAIYSTPYKRTQQTAQPLAQKLNQQVITYNPAEADLKAMAAKHEGQSIIIVGHSNTIPMYVNKLIGENKYPDIDEAEFGNIFIITLENGRVSHELLKI